MPTISLSQVSKLFGRFAALRQVSADFAAGRCYAILGENGAGKSTLLRLVAGLARPTSGDISILGSTDIRSQSRRVGYMAHASLLYDELSALENLRYFAALYGSVSPQALKNLATEVGLDPALQRHVGDYSQGMRQRLSLARAALHGPEIFLLDEPFANLDPIGARWITTLLGEWRGQGKTILVVTHQAEHLAPIADESLWLAQGEIVRRAAGLQAVNPGWGARS
jgi:heme ABC exporter ATP-binding subunit CcmA